MDAFHIIQSRQEAINLFSVSPPNRNPYFNMVEENAEGYYQIVKKPEKLLLTRQSAPVVYDVNASFYFYRRAFFEKGYKGAITDKLLVYVVSHICFDLDHPIDYEFLSFLITQNKLDFEL
jgi:CMP-N-acetylneuraminic acid synthetase